MASVHEPNDNNPKRAAPDLMRDIAAAIGVRVTANEISDRYDVQDVENLIRTIVNWSLDQFN